MLALSVTSQLLLLRLPHFPRFIMILGQIAWVDCIAFLLFLTPQLIIHVGLLDAAICGIKALPFLRRDKPVSLPSTNTH